MGLKNRIKSKSKKYSERNIKEFYNDLEKIRDFIDAIRSNHKSVSNESCINIFNNIVFKMLEKSYDIKEADYFRFIALENLLNSKDYDKQVLEAQSGNFFTSKKDSEYNGNFKHDIKELLHEYYDIAYDYKISRLRQECINNSSNLNLQKELKELIDEYEKIKNGSLQIYEENKVRGKQRKFLELYYKKARSTLKESLTKSISLNLSFLENLGYLEDYIKSYNHLTVKTSTSPVLAIKDVDSFIEQMANKKNYENMSIQELMALNVFWINRLSKVVENFNSVVYVLKKTGNLDKFNNGQELDLEEGVIKEKLAEYNTISSYITQYKLGKRDNRDEIREVKNSNFSYVPLKPKEIFSESDFKEYGFDELANLLIDVAKTNNLGQLLYDQKDILIESLIVGLLNRKSYQNAGFMQERKSNNSKVLIGIDLKGYNAPITLHYHKDSLKKLVKKVTGNSKMPMYRGSSDIIIPSSQYGDWFASTIMLFPLSKEQRKSIIEKANKIDKRFDNNAYVKHIAWMINPKKDMPEDIREPHGEIDLDSGEIIKLEGIKKEINR